jgi:putative ABC transport system permease protein
LRSKTTPCARFAPAGIEWLSRLVDEALRSGTGERVILLRGLRHRAGTTAAILLVGLCAVGSAVVGPTYYNAARQSIVADTFSTAPLLGRGVEANGFGLVDHVQTELTHTIKGLISVQAGGDVVANRLFGRPTVSLEADTLVSPHNLDLLLVARTNVCAAVTIASGSCPTAGGQLMVSAATARATKLKVGAVVHSTAGALTVAGIYATPQPDSDVWDGRGPQYFPQEVACPQSNCGASTYDAVFTPAGTLAALPPDTQAAAYEDLPLRMEGIKSSDVATINKLVRNLLVAPVASIDQLSLQSTVPETVTEIRADWRSLSVPVTIVTLELLVLIWILLFVVVADAHEARSAEISLAKLRGYRRLRAMTFALGQPTATILAALPFGIALGWLAARTLSEHLLRSGTAVPLPTLAWETGILATLGGLAAVVLGARSVLFRPVIEQWRRTPRQGGRRGWVLDAVIATAAVAGLAELVAGGSLKSSHHSPVALLVPGLLGLTFAVTSSRILPIAARLGYRVTRRRGIAAFLALRQIGRRPGAVRTTVVLTTATALAVFGASSWLVGHHNRERIANLEAGAPTVLTVTTRTGADLATVVDKIDPGGTNAVAVERATTGGIVTYAVQPQRFAAVAHWSDANVVNPAATLARLQAPSPGPIPLDSTEVRVRASASKLSYRGSMFSIDIATPDGYGSSALPLHQLTAHPTTSAELLPKGAVLAGFDIQAPSRAVLGFGASMLRGRITIESIELRSGGRWHPITNALSGDRWQVPAGLSAGAVKQVPTGLQWTVRSPISADASLTVRDYPNPIPAIVTQRDVGGNPSLSVTGLDGGSLPITATDRVAVVPGAAETGGAVIDLDYAKLASYGNLSATTAQVWVRNDAAAIQRGLEKNGYTVVATTSGPQTRALLDRDGAGLASTVFAADAIFAALLAGFATLLTMIVAARRRRHEFASLVVAGVRRRTLHAALAIEQLTVIGAAALAGVVAGGIASAFVERDIPEVTNLPGGIALSYAPPLVPLISLIAAGVVALLLLAAIAGRFLVRSIDSDQLRAVAP